MLKASLYTFAGLAAFVLGTYAVTAWILGRALHQLRRRA